MSIKSGTGIACVKDEVKETEWTCACDKCEEGEKK
jgi:hypothetical protein